MIDERSRAQPELRTVLAGWIHDTEVILAVPEQHVFLTFWELGDASHQILDLVISFPVKRQKGLFSALQQYNCHICRTAYIQYVQANAVTNSTIKPINAR